jgi:DNA helicase IV
LRGPREPEPTTSAFDLPDSLTAKSDPALIAGDEEQFARITRSLEATITQLTTHLDDQRRAPVRAGQEALDRDLDVHRVTARLRTLRRFGLDLCLGRMVPDDGAPPVYVGRLGLSDTDGEPLLVDWRSPAAEPFFAATHADPMGLASRRRYRWRLGRVVDYWDEAFTAEGLEGNAALDDESSFIASLGASRSPRMRDVLGTIATDQDAIIRASSRGPLVVDGGPGTGKTVVALHRTAYLLYADPRLGHRRGGVLFVGPHQPYLNYVSDVLPSLGEEGVQTCTVRDLVPEGAAAVPEEDPAVAALKANARVVDVIDAAVRFYEQPPTVALDVTTSDGEVRLSRADWEAPFAAPAPGMPHNEARDEILEEVVAIVVERLSEEAGDGEDVSVDRVRKSLQRNAELQAVLNEAWPLIEPTDLVADLWSVPAYLRLCAPWLEVAEVRLLQRREAQAWTEADLPFLDAARHRLGDPDSSRRARRRGERLAAEREYRSAVVDDAIAGDDSEMQLMKMLRGADLQNALDDEGAAPVTDVDRLVGPFAHVVVDEAQELTDAQWQMLLLRNPSRSLTIVGDRAQARHGFTESWQERLGRVGLDRVRESSLSINYRTPAEVMAEAEPVIRAAIPDANVPTSIRENGIPVIHAPVAELQRVIDAWLEEHQDGEGVACVIGDPTFQPRERVQSLSPELAKGLEFDLVVLVSPETWGEGIEGAVDRYVAMTRATQRLVILSG